MSEIVVKVDEEFSPWFRDVRERILTGAKSLHLHEGHPDGIGSIITLFCDSKIFTILHKHTHGTVSYNFRPAPETTNEVTIAVDKAGFCADLALATFEEGLKFYQNSPPDEK